MKKQKIIALDFDGTILNSDHKITSNLSQELHKFHKEDGVVILATGRSLSGVLEFEKEIGMDQFSGYIIAYNGAEIFEYNKGQINRVFKTQFFAKDTTRLVDLIINEVHTIVTYSDEFISTNHENEYTRRGARLLGKKINDDLYHETPKIMAYEDKEKKDETFKIISEILKDEKINLFSSAPHAIEITPLEATKGNAINYICQNYNLDSNQIYCFGDSENDVTMFEACGKPIAMENAIEELKTLSFDTCASNNNDGVSNYLKNIKWS